MREKYRELSYHGDRRYIRIEGFRLDRLLNRAMAANIELKQVRTRSETELTCWISTADLKKLQKVGGAIYRITPLDRRGPLPSLLSFLSRPGRVIGCLIACALLIGQSFFVHGIEINGYRGIPEEALLRCLQEVGVKEGAYKPGIDWEKAEKTIFETFPEVTWAQLVYSGRLVILNIAETDKEIYDGSQNSEEERRQAGGAQGEAVKKSGVYTDIVATQSGYVEKLSPLYGLALVEAGDFVKEGQILITGRVPIEPTNFGEGEEKEYFVNAQGTVWAKVPYRLTFNQERYVWGGQVDGAQAKNDAKKTLIVNRREKTEAEAKSRVLQQIRIWAKENLPEHAEITNKSLKFSYKENIIEVGVTLEVRQQIGSKQEAVIGETDTDTRRDR